MKSNELRIGNFIYTMDVYLDKVIALSEIAIIGEFRSPIENIKPIPLTEEWLIKFGVKHRVLLIDKDYFSSIKLDLYIGDIWYLWGQRFKNQSLLDSILLAEIKYVHQLQNIYFALTGEELEIKKQ